MMEYDDIVAFEVSTNVAQTQFRGFVNVYTTKVISSAL